MFIESNTSLHSLVIGTSGSGKSIFSKQVRENAKRRGHLLVDTEMYRAGKGLKPYEQEYARRISLGLSGPLPRGLRGKHVTVISDVSRPNKPKRNDFHIVTTANGIDLECSLVANAIDHLQMQTGVVLNQHQLVSLMEEAGIDKTLAEFGEVDTQLREMLTDALSMKLVGRSWPMCESLYNAADKHQASFSAEFDAAAKLAGYKVC